ncbi:MAG: hypothetical protein ACYS99_21260 [Planctomycetota bacterium]|jgi:hypothetical protein
MRILHVVLLVPLLVLPSGCFIVGAVTGPFSGAIDAPCQVYEHNREAFEESPMLYGADALIVGAFGFGTGPLMGFMKGLSLDIQVLSGHVDTGDAWSSGPASVFRPFTGYWRTTPEHVEKD